MEGVTLLVLDFIALTLGLYLVIGMLLGIVGLIMRICNRQAVKNGKTVSKKNRQYEKAFCLLGIISAAVSVVLVVLYFIFIK